MTTIDTLYHRLFGARTTWIDARGVKTRVIEAGEGDPVLLLHGVSGQAESFARNIMPLAERFRVYAIDLLGHGLTEKPAGDAYSIERFVRHTVDVLDVLGARPAHIVGQSLGAWIGAWVALDFPQYVRRLVLNTAGGFRVTATESEFTESLSHVRANAVRAIQAPTLESVRQQMASLVTDLRAMPDEMAALRLRVFQRADIQKALPTILDALCGPERDPRRDLTPDRFRALAVPTLVLWGKQNRGTTWQEAEAASKLIPKGAFHVIDNAAHWPQWQQPEEFNRVVAEFLKA